MDDVESVKSILNELRSATSDNSRLYAIADTQIDCEDLREQNLRFRKLKNRQKRAIVE